MGAENGEVRKDIERKEANSTSQESDAILRYADLRAVAYNPFISKEERKDFAQNLIALVKTLNEGRGLGSEFREDLLKQIQTIEMGYISVKKVADAVKQLERESRGGVRVPHIYSHAIDCIKDAIENGVPNTALEPSQKTIQKYLYETRQRSILR